MLAGEGEHAPSQALDQGLRMHVVVSEMLHGPVS